MSIAFLLNQLAIVVLGHQVGWQKLALVDLSLLLLLRMVSATFGSVAGRCAGGFAVALVRRLERHQRFAVFIDSSARFGSSVVIVAAYCTTEGLMAFALIVLQV